MDIQHTKSYDLILSEGKTESFHHRLIKCIWELKRVYYHLVLCRSSVKEIKENAKDENFEEEDEEEESKKATTVQMVNQRL